MVASQPTRTGMPGTLRRWVADIRAGDATSLREIAAELDARGMLTRRDGRWHVSTVMNLLDRLRLREAACAAGLMSLVELNADVFSRTFVP